MSNWTTTNTPVWMSLTWFLIILTLRYEQLMAPPIWDSAMGVFPPAIYLAQNNFDVGALLHLEGWRNGGPNVHTFSLLTWLIAVVMMVTNSVKVTFLVLHLATFTGMAWALSRFTRLLQGWQFDRKTANVAALFVLLMPLVLVQVGRIYTEIPVLVLSIAALDAYTRGNMTKTILFCGVAVLFKLTAIALFAALLLALLLDREQFGWEKVRTILLLSVAPLMGLALWALIVYTRNETISWGSFEYLLDDARFRLSMVPDLYLLLALGLSCSIPLLPQIVIPSFCLRYGESPVPAIQPGQLNAVLVCVAMPLIYPAVILAIIYAGQLGLHRYFIPLIPFALTTILLMFRRLHIQRISFLLLAASCIFFLLNQQGRFYPYEADSFSIVERSDEANQFHEVQVLGIEMLQHSPEDVPVGISREIGYMISNPLMGYVNQKLPNTFLIYREPYASMSLGELPDQFRLLQTNRFHGGKQISRLVQEAHDDTGYSVTMDVSRRGPFSAKMFNIERVSNTPASDD